MAYKQDGLQSGVYEEKHHKIYSGKKEEIQWISQMDTSYRKKKRNLYKLLFLLKLIAPLQWFLKDQDIKFGV